MEPRAPGRKKTVVGERMRLTDLPVGPELHWPWRRRKDRDDDAR